MEILADEDGALAINDEVMECYDRIKEDIEVHLSSFLIQFPFGFSFTVFQILRAEHQILKVFNGPAKVDVIYPDPHKQPDGVRRLFSFFGKNFLYLYDLIFGGGRSHGRWMRKSRVCGTASLELITSSCKTTSRTKVLHDSCRRRLFF